MKRRKNLRKNKKKYRQSKLSLFQKSDSKFSKGCPQICSDNEKVRNS